MWAKLSGTGKKVIMLTGSGLVLLIVIFLVFVNSFLKPILRDRLHTLIVQGSDSLYTYTLGDIRPNFIGSTIVVENLQLRLDSNRYRQLLAKNALPALTFELNLDKASVEGIGILPLLLRNRVRISKINAGDASVTLLRHQAPGTAVEDDLPLWKAIQPAIKSISIHNLRFGNLQVAYRNTDTADAVRFRFAECFAQLTDFRIDSSAAADSNRVFFAKDLSVQLSNFQFISADTLYRMQAASIDYSSEKQKLEVVDFSMKPLVAAPAFYQHAGYQKNINTVLFHKLEASGLALHAFINNDLLQADSILLDRPQFEIYLDKSFPPSPESKIGSSPQQLLLQNGYGINIRKAAIRHASLSYTEKNVKTQAEGTVRLDQLDIVIRNISNDPVQIAREPQCVVDGRGRILGGTPIQAQFVFFLDSTEGQFKGTGSIGAVQAAQLNPISEPLAGVHLNSFNMRQLKFSMRGDHLTALSDVAMPYSNLDVVFLKTDKETGVVGIKKLITTILNKYSLYSDNPGPEGVERTAAGIKRTRTSAQSFAALIWQAIFGGMQDIMMKKS